MLGFSKEELLTKKISDIHPHEIPRIMAFADKIMHEGNGWTNELSCRTKFGDYLPTETSASRVIIDGQILVISMVRDISERLKAKKELEELNKVLEKRVEERTQELLNRNEELNTALVELKRVNYEIDHFLYKVSHDFRAPLLSILGLTNLARKEKGLTKPYEDYLSLIEKSIIKLDRLNGEVADLIKNKRLTEETQFFSLKELVFTKINEFQASNDSFSIQWRVEIPDDLELNMVKFRMGLVLHNLISNAIKFRDQNKEKCVVRIQAYLENDLCIIEFYDNGIGIPEECMPKIYDMFYRGCEQSDGFGLGLYIAKEAVHHLGGTIQGSSELGRWTLFKITIPKCTSTNE